jgi:hypothetical protein
VQATNVPSSWKAPLALLLVIHSGIYQQKLQLPAQNSYFPPFLERKLEFFIKNVIHYLAWRMQILAKVYTVDALIINVDGENYMTS